MKRSMLWVLALSALTLAACEAEEEPVDDIETVDEIEVVEPVTPEPTLPTDTAVPVDTLTADTGTAL